MRNCAIGAALFVAAEAAVAWFGAPAAPEAPAAAGEEPVAEAWVVEGRRARIPHAHPVKSDRAGDAFYVDTSTDGQLVAYLAKEKRPTGDGWSRYEGVKLRFETRSKRPGDTKTYPVTQLEVRSVTPLPAADRVESLIAELGRDDVDGARKEKARQEIYAAGIDAFPVLIAHLDDERVASRELLHRLILPVGYESPKYRVLEPRGRGMFLVEDWRAFWRARRGRTLADIHEELEPLVDRYYESGGEAQAIP